MTACLIGLGLVGVAAPASASGGDIGYQDQSFAGASAVPTADKPQSKLWFNDGRWWADMFSSTAKIWHIFWLDRSSGGSTWRDTGVAVDTRANASADTLWDGSKLYIATNVFRRSSAASASNHPARLYRYSYSSSTKKYTLDPGFPSKINNYSSESLTIDEDSSGVIWATWTQVSGTGSSATNAVYLNSLDAGSTSWGTPFVVPASNTNPRPAPDDISAVVAFGGSKVGVLWSNQLDGTVYWAVHSDGAPRTTWTGGIAVRGSKMADDHMNLKAIQTDSAGRVFAVVKTSLDHSRSATPQSPLIDLLVFKPGTGSWTTSTFGRIVDCHTRPQLLLDDANQTVYVVATGPTASGVCTATGDGTIYMKSAAMSNPVFPTGVGTPIIRDAASDALNNPTTTKQTVSGTTGLVVLASNTTTDRYWHADIPIGPSTPAVPTASFTASPTSGAAPLAVSFTDTSTESPTSWAWSFGDGGTATTQNPSHTFSAAGSYTVTLRASNAAGTSVPVSKTIEVTSSVPPSGGGCVSVGSSTTATSTSAASTVSVPRPAGLVDGDVLVAQMTVDYAPKVRSVPPGWSAVVAPINLNSRATVLAYYHVVSSAASEPASYAWTLSSGVKWNAGMTDFHGVDTASPFDTPAVTAASTGSTSTSLVLPGVTTVTAGAVVVGGVGANNSTATAVPPSGWTEALEATSAQVTELAYQARPATGATGSATWTYSRAVNAGGWLRALKPA